MTKNPSWKLPVFVLIIAQVIRIHFLKREVVVVCRLRKGVKILINTSDKIDSKSTMQMVVLSHLCGYLLDGLTVDPYLINQRACPVARSCLGHLLRATGQQGRTVTAYQNRLANNKQS